MDKVTDQEEMGEFAALYSVLQADINRIYPYEKGDVIEVVHYPDPVYLSASDRRSLVRSVFAFIEGNAYFLRLTLLKNFRDLLSPEVQLALAEQQIEVTGHGTVNKKPMRGGALNMLKLTVNSFKAVLPDLHQVNLTGADFEALVRSVKVRDRLMHPKSAEALKVSDEEIRDVAHAFNWFGWSLMNLMKSANDGLKERTTN
jgi:hypothetical protein